MGYVIHNPPCTCLELSYEIVCSLIPIGLSSVVYEIGSSSSRASSFVWPLPASIQRNEKPEGAISVLPGVSDIENPESDGTEVNLPAVVIHLLETNALRYETAADVPLRGLKREHPVGIGLGDAKVLRVFDLRKLARVGAGRGPIAGCRNLLTEGLMRADFVVFLPELIECPLLSSKARPGRFCRLRL